MKFRIENLKFGEKINFFKNLTHEARLHEI